jgi:hypothetical protein
VTPIPNPQSSIPDAHNRWTEQEQEQEQEQDHEQEQEQDHEQEQEQELVEQQRRPILPVTPDRQTGAARRRNAATDGNLRVCQRSRNVRVRLRDFDREFCGRLSLVELPLEQRHARHQRLRIGSFEFTAAEIESCIRED